MPDTVIPGHPHLTWWRRWAGTIAFFALVIVGAGGYAKVESEGHVRETQFCELVLNQHKDRVTRLKNTVTFLSSPAGHQPTALNVYIRRISLPQSKDEVAKEREGIPDVCWQYDS